MIPVDGGETSGRRQLATRRMIRRPRETKQAKRGRGGSESFPKFDPWIYIA